MYALGFGFGACFLTDGADQISVGDEALLSFCRKECGMDCSQWRAVCFVTSCFSLT